MESMESDEGSSNAPKHQPAPQKKRQVQKKQKRGPGRPRKHPLPAASDHVKVPKTKSGAAKENVSIIPGLLPRLPTPAPPL